MNVVQVLNCLSTMCNRIPVSELNSNRRAGTVRFKLKKTSQFFLLDGELTYLCNPTTYNLLTEQRRNSVTVQTSYYFYKEEHYYLCISDDSVFCAYKLIPALTHGVFKAEYIFLSAKYNKISCLGMELIIHIISG